MPSQGKTVAAARSEARLYLGKAGQFLDECRSAVDAGRNDAALLNAIHAAISATDAVTVGLAGRRSSDPDHQRAGDLLEQVAGTSGELRAQARQLRELLAKKNAIEYESRRGTAREARDALRRAERFVRWAREILDQARLGGTSSSWPG